MATTGPSEPESAPRPARQAVILVHGMGEIIPMDTIKGFAETVWQGDTIAALDTSLWSKPDQRTGSLELRRITTRRTIPSDPPFPAGVLTDFYELYWADLTAGSTWDQVTGWARYLLFRRWSRVPPDVRGAWVALWAVTVLLVLAIMAVTFVPGAIWNHWFSWLPDWLAPWLARPAILGILGAATLWVQRKATQYFGRVVKYTRADPENIAARAATRARGLDLLRALHRDAGEGGYARVILAAHSLGSILAYDLIAYFWAEQWKARGIEKGSPAFAALVAVEQATEALEAAKGEPAIKAARDAYRLAQAALRRAIDRPVHKPSADEKELREQQAGRWLISDFVTFGSPLTHAEFLMANNDLEQRRQSREVSTIPPMREPLDKNVAAEARADGMPIGVPPRLMAFPDHGLWWLHHAAAFAAVRWTNVYDPVRFLYQGDLVGGPMRENFGRGVEDVNLAEIDGQSRRFTHTLYWDGKRPKKRLDAVRKAVNLLDR